MFPLPSLHCTDLKLPDLTHDPIGTIITVANVGDSRVILGYQKDVSPLGTKLPKSPCRLSALDSPGTSHEEISLKDMKHKMAGDTYVYEVGADLEEEDNRVWGNITVMPLSTDHKPDDPKEAAAILAAGEAPCSLPLVFSRSRSVSHTSYTLLIGMFDRLHYIELYCNTLEIPH